jgi:predicted unusual protein kinase regulating ubiquinone biosynthesis (AarF/ABC1/UbiB family)/nucleotide-binding universal stress UspA family protein
MVQRILVATDDSPSAARAVQWAGEMADRYQAGLVLLRVLPPEHLVGQDEAGGDSIGQDLDALAERVAGPRGHARLVLESDPSQAIVDVADEEGVDLVVVGNVGMGGRREFLLGNIPNRVSHNARCSVVIVNTAPAGGDAAAAPAGGAAPAAEKEAGPTPGDLLGRAARIARVMASHGVRGRFGSPGAGEEAAQAQARHFREALDELGPTFAKLGQILSTRPDLLPQAFVDELTTLQDRVTPLTEAEVVALMEQELRVPWEDVFASIEPQPLAAGSIAQVHRAVLASGSRVVVKVQRPTAERDILQDLRLLEMFAEQARGREAFEQVVDLGAVVDHLSTSLRQELDFRNEAANVARMREVVAPFPRLAVPHVHGDLSTARLLVMEEIQGVPVSEAPAGDARTEAARQLLESYYHQVLAEGFFHADPHPGNLLWCDDRIYFLDLGMAGQVEPGVRELLLLLLLAFWQEDDDFLADVLLMVAGDGVPRHLNVPPFREDLGKLAAGYRGVSLKDIRLGPLLQQMTEISIRHGVRLPASLALAGKAFGQMQLATAELDPTLDPFDVAGSFFMRHLRERARGLVNPRTLVYEGEKLRLRATRLLESLESVTGARPGRNLQIDFQGTQPLEETVRRAGGRLALGAAGGAALVATAIAASAARPVLWLTIVLGAVGAGVLVWLLADIRFRRR